MENILHSVPCLVRARANDDHNYCGCVCHNDEDDDREYGGEGLYEINRHIASLVNWIPGDPLELRTNCHSGYIYNFRDSNPTIDNLPFSITPDSARWPNPHEGQNLDYL